MTETIQTAMDRLMTISVEPQDYVAEDGLLYCGSCKTPKEAFFPNGKKLFGRDRHPAECRCRQATREKQEKEERARLHYEKVQRLKLQGFTDWAMQHWTFANDHGQNPQMQLAQRYVAHWPEMREKNVGLLLWGGVGTGKSFMAGCIANALMEQEVAVCMTNIARIMNELNSTFAGRNEVVRCIFTVHLAMFQFQRKTSGTALTRSCTSGWKNTVICRSWYGKALEKANSNQKK